MNFIQQYNDLQGTPFDLPVGKAVCVGRNYLDHINELNNAVPDEALLFIKSRNAFVPMQDQIVIPATGECHNELEIALLVGDILTRADKDKAQESIVGVGLALDLTLRDKQTELKQKGLPWERAKAFDGSCPLSAFARMNVIGDISNLSFSLSVNNQLRQSGTTAQMMRPWQALISEISHHFTLFPGDIVLTGTPKGVGKLLAGDKLTARLDTLIECEAEVFTTSGKANG